MEIKAGIKALSKLIPTSNNIEMAKAVEYDSKFEGGARVLVELPTSPNDILEPKLVDGQTVVNTLDTTFDFVDEITDEVEETKIPVKKEIPAVEKIPAQQNTFEDSDDDNEDSDDDISFDFPDNDEDDDDEDTSSGLF
jgi:hypothetical protein